MDFEIILISMPLLAIAIAVLFSTRTDTASAQLMTKARENPAIKFQVIISSIIAPIMILYMNNTVGVIFLTIGGLMMIFQKQLFAGQSLMSNKTAKVFGYIYLVMGALWSIST